MASNDRLSRSESGGFDLGDWSGWPLLTKIFAVVPSVVYVYNHESQANEFSSPAMTRLTGFSPKDLREMGPDVIGRLITRDDLPRVMQHFKTIQGLSDGEVRSIEYRLTRKDGTVIWVLSQDTVFDRDVSGNVIRHIGTATDVTAQRETAKAAREVRREADRANRILGAVFDTVGAGIVGLDAHRRVLTINPRARHILGGISASVPFDWPKNIVFLEPGKMRAMESSADPINRALSKTEIDAEVHLLSRAHSTEARYVRVSSTQSDDAETGLMTVIVLEDVTVAEKARQQVERSSRLDALGQLTGGIAHDFNNLIATTMYAVQLSLQSDAKEANKLLRSALSSMERGQKLTHRLLAFAQRQPGLAESKRISDIFSQFKALVRPVIEEDVEMVFQDVEPDLAVYCDTDQLENALLNLVLNARDAIASSGRGDRITIQARIAARTPSETDKDDPPAEDDAAQRLSNARSEFVEMSVSDNGPGMADEVKRRAIDPFFTTRQKKSSSGLGLSMVYGFVQQSNGSLRIYSEEGQGSTISLTLPRGKVDQCSERSHIEAPVMPGLGETVLLVEDEIDLQRMMQRLLRNIGYDAVTANSGADALKLIEDGLIFDVLMTDVVMPGGVGGFELARAVRERRPGMPVVYMSGYTGFSEEEMGSVVAPLVRKPSPPATISRTLAKVLGRED